MENLESLQIILASSSPRRKQLLELAGIHPTIWPGAPDETPPSDTPAEEWAIKAASVKAMHFEAIRPSFSILITADTTVVFDNQVLNKPKTKQEAFSMLQKLNGNTHFVITGVCLLTDMGIHSFQELTEVRFRSMSDEFLRSYADSGEALDKAGAYGAQDKFGILAIHSIKGCFYNVVGLPVGRIIQEIKQLFKIKLV